MSWLAKHHEADVVTVTLDLGQSGDLAEIRDHALTAGAVRAHVLDKREEFAREIVLPSLKAGALSDTRYPMATALSRPLIAQTLVEIAAIENATHVAHGGDRARSPPPRAADRHAQSRAHRDRVRRGDRLREQLAATPRRDSRVDDNLWGRTIGRRGDDGSTAPDESVFKTTRRLDATPAMPAHVEVEFERGAAVGINGVTLPFMEMIESLATIAGEHGVGRLDRIKVRADGTRSRAFYEAPAAVVLHIAHAELWRFVSSESQQRFDTAVSLVVRRSDRSRRMVRSAAHRPRCVRERDLGTDDRDDPRPAVQGRGAGRRQGNVHRRWSRIGEIRTCLSRYGPEGLTRRPIRRRSISACRSRSIGGCSKTT